VETQRLPLEKSIETPASRPPCRTCSTSFQKILLPASSPTGCEVANSVGKEERSRELVAEGVYGTGRPDDLSEVRSVLVLLRSDPDFQALVKKMNFPERALVPNKKV